MKKYAAFVKEHETQHRHPTFEKVIRFRTLEDLVEWVGKNSGIHYTLIEYVELKATVSVEVKVEGSGG